MVTVYDVTCTGTPVSSSVVNVTATPTVTTSGNSNLNVGLHLYKSKLVGSSIWVNSTNVTFGFIELCIRVDLVVDPNNVTATSINFNEQKLFLTVNLLNGFTVILNNLSRNATSLANTTANAQYTVNVCRCNQQGSCVSDSVSALVQGSDVFLCVYSGSANVQVVGIAGLTLTQGFVSIASIVASNPDAVTDVSQSLIAPSGSTPSIPGSIIHSKMRSEFFVAPTPAPVVVNGFAILPFQRRLHVVPLPRTLQQSTTGDFNVTLSLTMANAATPTSEGGDSTTVIIIAVVASAVAVLAVAAIFYACKRRYPGGRRKGTEMKGNASRGNETDDGDNSDGGQDGGKDKNNEAVMM